MGKKQRIIIVVVGVLLIVAAWAGSRFYNQKDNGAMELSGNIEVTEPNVGFKMPGRVVELLADEGQKINKGDRLAILDRAEAETFVVQNRAVVSEAAARLEAFRQGSRPQEIEQAKAAVSALEAELTRVKKDYERAERLYAYGAISAAQFDAAKSARNSLSEQHKNALAKMSLVKEGPRKEDIRAAEQRLAQAKAVLNLAEQRLLDTVITAPVSGVILKRNCELGEIVGAGIPVFTIGEIEKPWVKVYVKEDKIGWIKLGQKATVTVDSFPDKKYEGIVTFISSEAEFTPKNVQTKEERIKLVFAVKVGVRNVNDELKPGMPADVRIALR